MGTKDNKTKEYLKDNARFADIVNFYLFKGKKVVSAADLKERDTTECLTVYGADKAEITKQKWRDLLKSCTVKEYGNILIFIIGLEDQSDIHYAMPVKNMLYDAMNYSSQVTEAANLHTYEMKGKETIDMCGAIEAIKRNAVMNERRAAEKVLADERRAAEKVLADERRAAEKKLIDEKRAIAQKLMDDLNVTKEKAFQLVGIPCTE